MLRPRVIFREEECEDGKEEEETPVTESDSDEHEGADTVSKETTPRYFMKWWQLGSCIISFGLNTEGLLYVHKLLNVPVTPFCSPSGRLDLLVVRTQEIRSNMCIFCRINPHGAIFLLPTATLSFIFKPFFCFLHG